MGGASRSHIPQLAAYCADRSAHELYSCSISIADLSTITIKTMAWLYYILLFVVMITGLLLNIVGLPGLWLIVLAYAGYAALTGWDVYVGWPSLLLVIVLATAAEIVEFVAGAAGSKAAGGRTRGMIGAVVGGFLGAIFLSIIPIPVVAQIFGACLGAFLGAMIMEMTDKDIAHSLRVGAGAAKGRFLGIVSKLCFGIAMMLVAAIAGIPIGGHARATTGNVPPAAMIPAASTVPTTQTGSVDATSLAPYVVGIWRSPDKSELAEYFNDGTVSSDRPTYMSDGEIFSHAGSKRNWRIENNAVEVGSFNKAGTFIREGDPRPIERDSKGRVVSIGGWTRVPTTAPTTRTSGT
jgi:uncharacterized protein YqgC (DUF456 family)